jgi:hypothetical protein
VYRGIGVLLTDTVHRITESPLCYVISSQQEAVLQTNLPWDGTQLSSRNVALSYEVYCKYICSTGGVCLLIVLVYVLILVLS